jgi:hypothetical protein
MIEKALDGGGASRGWPPVEHPSSEFTLAEDMLEATDYESLIGFELFKQSLTIARSATGGNYLVW